MARLNFIVGFRYSRKFTYQFSDSSPRARGAVKELIFQFLLIFNHSLIFLYPQIGMVQSQNCIYKQQGFSVSRSEKGDWGFGLRIISMLM